MVENDAQQCQLLSVEPPSPVNRAWLPTGAHRAAAIRVHWTMDCNIRVTSRDTAVANVEAESSAPGTTTFYFSGVHAGWTQADVTLGRLSGPPVELAVSDSQTLRATVAHRGAGVLAPENTLAAIRLAAAFPVPGLEFDTRLTSDSVPILMHDATFSRTTGYSGRVSQTTFLFSQTLNAARYAPGFAPEPPPGLLDALDLLRYNTVPLILVDLKHDSTFAVETEAAATLSALRRSGIANSRVVLHSGSPSLLQRVRALDDSVRLGYASLQYDPRQHEFLAANRVDFMLYPLSIISAMDSSLLARFRENDVQLLGFTAQTIAEADSFIRRFPTLLVISDVVPALYAHASEAR